MMMMMRRDDDGKYFTGEGLNRKPVEEAKTSGAAEPERNCGHPSPVVWQLYHLRKECGKACEGYK